VQAAALQRVQAGVQAVGLAVGIAAVAGTVAAAVVAATAEAGSGKSSSITLSLSELLVFYYSLLLRVTCIYSFHI
jgi:hypothetical protein